MTRAETGAAKPRGDEPAVYRLMLFVAGEERNSRMARENLERLCREELPGRAEIAVVNVLEDFETALEHHIVVTPALFVLEPRNRTLVLGNLSDTDALRGALGLPPR